MGIKSLSESVAKSVKFIPREISWLNFNYRVLHQTSRKTVPLLEKLKFLGISFSNLDEFISVRFSDLYDKAMKEYQCADDIGETNYIKNYATVLNQIFNFKNTQYKIFNSLIKEIEARLKIKIIESYKEISKNDRKELNEYFIKNIFPILTPIAYESTKEMPKILDRELNFLIKLSDKDEKIICTLSIPEELDRVISFDKGKKFIFIEEVVKNNLHRFFVNKHIENFLIFRSNKCFNEEVDHNPDVFIVDRMREVIKRRELSNDHVFIEIQKDDATDTDFVKILYKILCVPKTHVYKTKKPLGLSCLTNKFVRNELFEYPSFIPQYPIELVNEKIFDYLDRENILLQHPYESFDVVVNFLKEAAIDPHVVSIKQTLYRVSSEDSPIIDALCRASMSGKRVTVMLELLARYDEKQNINLVDTLKAAGINVIYGLENFKTHCKICLIARKHRKGVKLYAHMGTGNYNESTSKIYTDITYMTSETNICMDLNNVFNILSGFSMPKEMKTISFSPINIRSKLYDLIDREVRYVKKGKKGIVDLKMNSLCDLGMMNKIKQAAKAGVKFNIICRGICSIKSSDNIKIYSIIGRFLEHSRIYKFYNDGNEEVFISSADLLTRNLDKRIETMIPITDFKAKNKILTILKIMKKDTFNSFEMNKKGEYEIQEKKYGFNSHKVFIKFAQDKKIVFPAKKNKK